MSLTRLFGIWLVLALAMTANGVFRELFLKRSLGATAAGVVSAVLGTAIILLVTWVGFGPLEGASTTTLFEISVLLVALTVTFEFVVGHYVDQQSWRELAGQYAFWRGRLWPLVLLVLALTPFLWGRWLHTARQMAGT